MTSLTAEASSVRVSRGDVQSILNASVNGNHGNHTFDPSELELRASIRPGVGSPWDGRHFCVDDWHVLLQADLQPSRDNFADLTFDQVLDGMHLRTDRTPVKRLILPGGEKFYAVQAGTLFSPGSISVGAHTFSGTTIGFDGVNPSGPITFFIDPAGSGACL